MSDASGHRSVKSAHRALHLIELLAHRQPMRFTELAEELGVPKGSLHALLAGLAAEGWVVVERERGVVLGYRALALEFTPPDHADIVRLAAPELAALGAALEETVHLATLDGAEVVYLASRPSPHALSIRYVPGRRLPAHATALGKAMLARLGEERLRMLPPRLAGLTPSTITDPAALDRELEEIGRAGFAEDREEGTIGVRCVAVAVAHPDLPPLAISCSIPLARFDPAAVPAIAQRLLGARDAMLVRLRAVG